MPIRSISEDFKASQASPIGASYPDFKHPANRAYFRSPFDTGMQVAGDSFTRHFPQETFLLFGKNNLPDWARQVHDPKTDMTDLWPISKEVEATVGELKKGESLGKLFGKLQSQALKLFWQYQKIQQELLLGGIDYLPNDQREATQKYRSSLRHKVLMLLRPGYNRQRLIISQGPVAIKRAQEEYQLTEKLSHDMASQIDNLKTLKGLGFKLWMQKQQAVWILRMIRLKMQWDIRVYRPLGNRVPGVPKDQMKDQLEQILSVYNKEHRDHPLRFEDIGKKPVASGSMGQVFTATTETGKKLVLKVQRATPESLIDYLPYAYFCKLVFVGSDNRKKSAAEAEKQIQVLQQEADATNELNNARRLNEYVSQLGLKRLTVPLPLSADKSGLVMPFVGTKDLSALWDKRKRATLQRIGPELLTLQICSPQKLADLYFPNLRIGDTDNAPVFLIDHGRAFTLDPKTHRQLLKLVTLALASPYAQKQWGQDKQIRSAILELLPEQSTGKAAQLRRAVEHHDSDAIKLFVDLLLHQSPLLNASNTFSKGSEMMAVKENFPKQEPALNLLSFWVNYLALCKPEEGFPGLIASDTEYKQPNARPSVVDLSSAHNKYRNTLAAGFMEGDQDLSASRLKTRIKKSTGLSDADIKLRTLRQYRRLAGLDKIVGPIGETMATQSGLTLSKQQREDLNRRLSVALYCDLLT
ncbi:MAG: AarF/UbiB family protein [Vampirovibrionales bacterium]|nr:AarF/UbiB family protein [Vampirovibrionales bacterium]